MIVVIVRVVNVLVEEPANNSKLFGTLFLLGIK